MAAAPAPPSAEGLSGFPEHVDPLVAMARARSLTEREQLRRITIVGVGADGTVNFGQPQASIRYEFDSAPGEGPDAPRPAGTVRPVHYCGRQAVQIKPDGIAAEADQPKGICRASAGEALPQPRCGPRELWKMALQRGATADGRATAEYYRSHEGPAWRFTLASPQVQFTVYGDCEHELTGDSGRPL